MPGGAPQGYTGQMSLGGSTFSLAIDAGSFDRELKRAEAAASAASQKIGQSFGRGSNAAMGLLYLGQAVDDLQYGFRAIVNNIPQIAMAMGGGAGAAGAIGIVGVAINQLVSHLDELKAAAEMSPQLQQLINQIEDLAKALNDTSKAATGQGIQDLILGFLGGGGLTNVTKGLKAGGLGPGARAAAKQWAREMAEGKAAGKEIEGVTGSAQQERAKLFKEAMEQFGGGTKLQEDYAQRLMNANPKMALDVANNLANLRIKTAMEGGQFGSGVFGLGFEKVYDKLAWAKDTEKLNKAGEANEKETQGLHKDWTKILNAQGAENEQRMVAGLQAERDRMQKQAHMLQLSLSETKPSQSFGSMKDYLGSVAVGGADVVRKAQLDQLKAINKNTEKMGDLLKAVGQARFQ